MSWEEVHLREVTELITKGTTPSNVGCSFEEAGVNYIKSEMLSYADKYISEDGMTYISNETHEKLKRSQLQVQDILMSMAGAQLGKSAMLRKIDVPANTNQATALIRVDDSRAFPEYVYYALNVPNMILQINHIPNQSAQPNINLNQIGNLKIFLPPIETQKRIADILSSYDDLIENNRRQIKLLEEAAQRLYKEWFVDLKFPGHESTPIINGLPEGWKETSIGGSFTTVLGGTPSRENLNYWNGDIPWINSGEINSLRIIKESEFITELGLNNSSAKLMPCHTTVLAITGATLGQVSYTEIETCANQSVIGIIDKSGFYSIYIYLFISTEIRKMIGKATGGAQQHINKNIVNAYQIILPEDGIVKKLNDLIQPLFNKIAILSKQNLEIKEARDRLLPKLMSGEIEV